MAAIIDPQVHFAILSKYAYKEERLMKAKAEELGYTSTTFIEKGNAQCYILEDETRLVVAFRGTELTEAKDVIADIKFCKSKSKTKGGVHDGFFDEVNSLWSAITKHIGKEERKYKKIWMSGHSLGGAMSLLAASRLPSRIASVYTYGAPRVGNKRWCSTQRFVHHRYVNNNDIVPTLPPVVLCYRHYGELHYINYYGNIRKLSVWQKIKDQLRGHYRAWSKFEFFNNIIDHNIDQYIRKLEKGLK